MRRALWARWILLACYLVFTLGWYFIALAPHDPLGLGIETNHPRIVDFLVATLVLFGLQFLLLLGAPRLHWPRPRRRRSIFISLAAGSAIGMLLSIGIVLAFTSLYKLIYAPNSFREETIITSYTPGPATAPAPTPPPRFDWRTDIPVGDYWNRAGRLDVLVSRLCFDWQQGMDAALRQDVSRADCGHDPRTADYHPDRRAGAAANQLLLRRRDVFLHDHRADRRVVGLRPRGLPSSSSSDASSASKRAAAACNAVTTYVA